MKDASNFSDSTLANSLAVEEYKFCRRLIEKNIDIIEKTEVYAVGAVAATAVFSISSTNRLVSEASSYIPLIISLVGTIRFYGIDKTINKINNYLVSVEKKYKGKINWTRRYRKENKIKYLKFSRYTIWIILVISGIVFVHVVYARTDFDDQKTSASSASGTVTISNSRSHPPQSPR